MTKKIVITNDYVQLQQVKRMKNLKHLIRTLNIEFTTYTENIIVLKTLIMFSLVL